MDNPLVYPRRYLVKSQSAKISFKSMMFETESSPSTARHRWPNGPSPRPGTGDCLRPVKVTSARQRSSRSWAELCSRSVFSLRSKPPPADVYSPSFLYTEAIDCGSYPRYQQLVPRLLYHRMAISSPLRIFPALVIACASRLCRLEIQILITSNQICTKLSLCLSSILHCEKTFDFLWFDRIPTYECFGLPS